METISSYYVKGFNHAYLLAQHNPKLLDKILSTPSEKDYFIGMKDGKHTHKQELKQFNRLLELDKLKKKEERDLDQEL